MSEDKKKYRAEVKVEVKSTESYSNPEFLVKFEEIIPPGTDPVSHLRKRLREEMDRNAPYFKPDVGEKEDEI